MLSGYRRQTMLSTSDSCIKRVQPLSLGTIGVPRTERLGAVSAGSARAAMLTRASARLSTCLGGAPRAAGSVRTATTPEGLGQARPPGPHLTVVREAKFEISGERQGRPLGQEVWPWAGERQGAEVRDLRGGPQVKPQGGHERLAAHHKCREGRPRPLLGRLLRRGERGLSTVLPRPCRRWTTLSAASRTVSGPILRMTALRRGTRRSRRAPRSSRRRLAAERQEQRAH